MGGIDFHCSSLPALPAGRQAIGRGDVTIMKPKIEIDIELLPLSLDGRGLG